jgi:hypothetical protein
MPLLISSRNQAAPAGHLSQIDGRHESAYCAAASEATASPLLTTRAGAIGAHSCYCLKTGRHKTAPNNAEAQWRADR